MQWKRTRILIAWLTLGWVVTGCGPAAPKDPHEAYWEKRNQPHHRVIGYDPRGMPIYGVDEDGHPIYKPIRDEP